MHAKLVATFGLDEEENAFIEKHLHRRNVELWIRML